MKWRKENLSQNIMKMIVCKIFFCFLCPDQQVQLIKKCHFSARIYFIFLKKRPKTNLKLF